ncbi:MULTISPECIES: DUF2059 domain-containing protein [Emticicia]|uniref:DUF2059 domain-containing protein n=1 Tax=Emticicia TaxID=312278 RepID=UPI00209F1746|nr:MULTISPECIES: DUF2059 domain-containing protein [Emticicia]UTA70081.1 DUF2059 domain-containing protein [Emticicia sp. 21SJ11W-3]
MKKSLTLLFLFVSFASLAQNNEAKIKDIKHFLVVSGAINAVKVTIENMVNSMKNSTANNNLPEGFLDEFKKEINYQEFVELYIPIYDKHFSHQEIRDMIIFYETPTGKKLVEKTPMLLTESMNAGREWGQKMGIKVYEKMQKKQANTN